MLFGENVLNDRPAYNKALLSDKFSAERGVMAKVSNG